MNRNYLLYLAGLAIIVGAFFAFKPNQVAAPTSSTQSATSSTQVKTFDLDIQNKKLSSGPAKIQVGEADHVIIRISSDTEEEFHLHGYDKSVNLKPGETVQLDFDATLTGSFPFELEQSKVELRSVEVTPR